ncbi:adhesion G-protein coupled receptor G4 [Anastrepha ludens]|uniref:adhesion G-protein coupled receptor G4 n=1 Tax=Anastrepha ludens TaxID=28586 RepID=UPI0023AF4AF1|nr:adhesion G-protein coupled receptor G4 [Anastrepha ludens]
MNFYILILLVALIHQYQHKLAIAHLRPLNANVDSDEDKSESENGGAPEILTLLKPLPPIPHSKAPLWPPTNHRYPELPHTLRPLTSSPANNRADKPAIVNVTVADSTLTASAYSGDSYSAGSNSELYSNTFTPLIRNSSTEVVRNSSAMPTSAMQYCEPEVFKHDYIIVENLTHPTTNVWKRARAGERAGLREVCLKPNGLPLTRLCRYDKQKRAAEWEDISDWPRVVCMRQTRECILSDKLNKLHEQLLEGQLLQDGVAKRVEVTDQLYKMLRETNLKFLPADVHLTSQILHEVAVTAQDTELSVDMVRICDRLMASDPKILRISADLNATNSILDTFEYYMDALSERQVPTESCTSTSTITIISQPSDESSEDVANGFPKAVEEVKMGHMGVRAHISANISVFFVNPSCANISGIAVYALTSNQDVTINTHALLNTTVGNFRYRFINMNESVAALMQEPELQVAGFLPTHLWEQVRTTLLAKGKLPVVVLKVYGHDALFVDPALVHTRKPFSKILSISIPGYNQNFPEPLTFLLRNRYDYMDSSLIAQPGTGCGYWNYTSWVNTGVQTDVGDLFNTSVIECRTQHLTQFSFLLGGTYKQVDISDDVLITPIHLRALDIISLVGCSLSLIGLLGIWVTAILFKSWRTLASTKVLLNLCVALTLQMVLFLFVNTEDMSAELVEDRLYINCIVLGAFMQYSILVLFIWMLIIAVLQFQRYVTVIGIERPKRYILKSAIVAWGVPIIPTLLVVCIDPSSYIPTEYELQTNSGICYPSGLGLTLGVIVPIAVIVVANLTIFIYVFYSISHTLNQAMQRNEKKMTFKQIRLSVLLFFLLGISWIFGLFAYMQGGIIFSYLFCLTATLQGFVLFIYFVLLDEVPRGAWLDLLHPQRKKKSSKRVTELQSMTTSTGVESGSCGSRDTMSRVHRSEHSNGRSPAQALPTEGEATTTH